MRKCSEFDYHLLRSHGVIYCHLNKITAKQNESNGVKKLMTAQ